jgi:hypothetical protein
MGLPSGTFNCLNGSLSATIGAQRGGTIGLALLNDP